MGKLADRLKELARGSVQQVGFTAAVARTSPPSMLVLAQVDTPETEAASGAAQTEADAVLVSVGPATEDDALKALRTATRRTLWGGALSAGSKELVDRLQKAGCDFVLLSGGVLPADILTEDKIDKVLEVDIEWPDTIVRGIEQLPVEAVVYRLLGGDGMTINQLLQCHRVVGLARKPVFAALPPSAGTGQLLSLRDAGISGVIVPAAVVKDFCAAVRALPPPKKPHDRMEAMLPMGLHVPRHEHEEEEEEPGD